MSAVARPRDFWVSVRGERADDWKRVFGPETKWLPIVSPIPQLAGLPGFAEPQPVYLLDLEWVVEQGRWEELVRHLAARFGLPASIVDRELDAAGVPILADDTVVRVDNPARWFS